MNVHQKIKAFRESRFLTHQQFADAVGVSRGAVQQWEKGVTAPTRKNQPIVAKYMGITKSELMEDCEMLPPSSSAIAITPSQPVQPVGREPNLPKFPDGEICKEISVYSLLSTLAEELQDVEPEQRDAVGALLLALSKNPTSEKLVAALTALMDPLPEQIPKKKAHA